MYFTNEKSFLKYIYKCIVTSLIFKNIKTFSNKKNNSGILFIIFWSKLNNENDKVSIKTLIQF